MTHPLQESVKTKDRKRKFVIDFPDYDTKEIFAIKWHNFAYMLGLQYTDQSVGYAENKNQKIRYEITLRGTQETILEFIEFIDKTLLLIDDIECWPDV